jgi:hypothetical protein
MNDVMTSQSDSTVPSPPRSAEKVAEGRRRVGQAAAKPRRPTDAENRGRLKPELQRWAGSRVANWSHPTLKNSNGVAPHQVFSLLKKEKGRSKAGGCS